jgi:hypothetical protein
VSVELVNGYVLLPHAPDWNVKPQFRREWRTSIADGVTGTEDRLLFRHLPLRGVEFQILACTLEEQRRLVARILAAKKSGWAAVPLWGRGSALAAPATGDAVTLQSESAWPWAKDDFVFFSRLEPDDPDACEVRQVESVAGPILTLDQTLARTYRRFCWPVLLGRFRCDDLRALTSHHATVRVSVLERDVRPEPLSDLCAIEFASDIGVAGDTFDCYAVQDPVEVTLRAGNGWATPWDGAANRIGLVAMEPFQGYVIGTATLLNKGTGWSGPADLRLNRNTYVAFETFDYATGAAVPANMANGIGWAGAPDIATNA